MGLNNEYNLLCGVTPLFDFFFLDKQISNLTRLIGYWLAHAFTSILFWQVTELELLTWKFGPKQLFPNKSAVSI